MKASKVGILGGGVSGLALAANLERPCEVLEGATRTGGLSGSIQAEGFTFDAAGPHIMFSKNAEVLAYMVSMLGENVHQARRDNKIAFKGALVKYPFENDLGALPLQDRYECLISYLQNPPASRPPQNLQEWAHAIFGAGIADKYLLPYNRKIWKWDPADTALTWAGRIPRPPLEDVVKSALGIPTEGYTHQLYFYYPKEGGYESLTRAFHAQVADRVTTNFPVTRVGRVKSGWEVEGPRGETRQYDTLVSTLPVHELFKIWDGAPESARAPLADLKYNALANVLLGFSEDRGHPYTAIYVPDPTITFHRLSFMKNFSASTVPAGCSSIMCEITTRPGEDTWESSDDALVERALAGLEALGLADRKTLIYRRVARFAYGYPIADLAYEANVGAVRAAVADAGVHLLGRFAEFDYINSDVCVERALALAGRLNAAAPSPLAEAP